MDFERCAMAAVVGVLLALAGGGCAVDQRKEVAVYRRVLDLGPPAATRFEPGQVLPLRQVLLLANEHNERLSIEGESYLHASPAEAPAAVVG